MKIIDFHVINPFNFVLPKLLLPLLTIASTERNDQRSLADKTHYVMQIKKEPPNRLPANFQFSLGAWYHLTRAAKKTTQKNRPLVFQKRTPEQAPCQLPVFPRCLVPSYSSSERTTQKNRPLVFPYSSSEKTTQKNRPLVFNPSFIIY